MFKQRHAESIPAATGADFEIRAVFRQRIGPISVEALAAQQKDRPLLLLALEG